MVDDIERKERERSVDKKDIRSAMEISSFLGDTGMRILPGKEWGVYYKNAQREETLRAVLEGRLDPARVDIEEMKPYGISYKLEDVRTVGLAGMVGRVRDVASFHKHFDHRGFLDFLAGLKGRNVDLETATRLFESTARSRIQSEMLRALGITGKNQLKKALGNEAGSILSAEDTGKIRALLDLLKLRWLGKQGIVSQKDVLDFEAKVGEEIRNLADELEPAYLDYVQKGDASAKKKLADAVRESFDLIQKQVDEDKLEDTVDEMMDNFENLPRDVQNEIDNAFNDYEPPKNDVPPGMRDKMSPSMDEMKSGEKKENIVPLFTVEPPKTGLYQGPIYSHFNASQVEWEMRHSMQEVSSASAPKEHLMRGKIAGNSTLPIYLPRNFAPGSIPQGFKLLKDENGTYYLRNDSNAVREYEVWFGRQNFANTSAPTASEKADISSGGLSNATENFLLSLRGKNNVAKAQAIIHYMKNILKLKYSNDSKFNRVYKANPSRYFTEIEKHKEVDCDVAQTYFIALCRKAGVPARLVIGHSVDLVKDNKAILHSGTGHAWTEIWDEKNGSWKTIDATPEKEKQDKDDGEKKEGGKAPEEKTDIEAPSKEGSEDSPSPEEVKKKVDDAVEDVEDGESEKGGGKSGPPDSAKEKMKQIAEKQKSKKSQESGGKSGEPEASEAEWQEMEKEMEEISKQHEEMTKKAEELKEKMEKAETFKDLKELEKELEESDIYEEVKEKLEEMLEAKEEEAKEELKKEIEKMRDDGFITEEEAERLLKELEDDKIEDFEKVEKQLEHESSLYNEYEEIREEVMPLVDEWFQFFADRLPRIEEVDHSEDMRTMRGRFDRRSIARPRNLLFGTTQNPLIVRDSPMPRFMASLVIDISGSMSGRMRDARKLLIFFSELFDKISEEYGYIKFSISAFDTVVELIKDFDQEYGSPKRYEFGNGEKTVKVRLMEMTMARGGTDMGKAVWEANKKLNEEKLAHPDYLSALYTISDGETGGELAGERLRRFMDGQESFWGEWWGQHMKCGFMLGPEHTRGVLAKYFGDDNAEAVPDIRDLIEKVMNRFDEDIQDFIRNLPE